MGDIYFSNIVCSGKSYSSSALDQGDDGDESNMVNNYQSTMNAEHVQERQFKTRCEGSRTSGIYDFEHARKSVRVT